MSVNPVILWFRRDLRLRDNPALSAAAKTGAPIIPLYILDDVDDHPIGSASQWWLHHSLSSLQSSLQKRGSTLILRKGPAEKIINQLIDDTKASAIFWNRRYYKPEIELDKNIKKSLEERTVEVHTFNGSLLTEPWELKTGSGGFYKVFTSYYKKVRATGPTRKTIANCPKKLNHLKINPSTDQLEQWNLLPKTPNWATAFNNQWVPGEQGAHNTLEAFLNGPVDHYEEDRNHPFIKGTSKLSPHLAFGEISPLKIWQRTENAKAKGSVLDSQAEKFISQVVWREFSHVLLYFFPDLSNKPMKPAFESFPWQENEPALTAWKKGKTGYPIVDAGMRELWQTGWMHNRVRMIVASFLIKHLMIPWQEGEKWFWDTLVDADIANNSASWQWVAGCGADASPYFRIFNPFTQGEKFDPEGHYVKTYVPELKKLPVKFIHQPWTASVETLSEAGIIIGKDYPAPIVEHKFARNRALDGYAMIKGK